MRGRCFLISTTKVDHRSALQECKNISANLAKIDREYVRKRVSAVLDRQNPRLTTYHVGLKAKTTWIGSDGRPLPNNMWAKGYPVQSGPLEVAIDSSLSKLVNMKYDGYSVGGVCMKTDCKYDDLIPFLS